MLTNLVIPLIAGLVIIALAVVGILSYKNSRTKKKANTREKNNSWYKYKRILIYSFFIGIIVGSIFAMQQTIIYYTTNGDWIPGNFLFCLFAGAFVTAIFGLVLGPSISRIKRNLLVRHQDTSLYSIFRTAGKILICVGPIAIGIIFAELDVSKGMADLIFFVGAIITAIVSSITIKRRTGKIAKGIREGCNKYANFESCGFNRITAHDIMDCITCDSVQMKENFVVKHDIADIGFSCVDFRTIVGKNSTSNDPAEAIHYKLTKKAKSPIICTFDSGITDSPLPIVETENPVFNKEFTTYCESSQDAFYILTPPIMEKMLEAQKKYKRLIFNFDGDDLFIIVYHEHFLRSLIKDDVDGAFKDTAEMMDCLVFDSIAKPGVHTEKASKPRKQKDWETQPDVKFTQNTKSVKGKKALLIIGIIVGIFILGNAVLFGVAFCSTCSSGFGNSGTHTNYVTDSEVVPIQNYLTQKYGQTFQHDPEAYNSKYDSDYSTSYYLKFKDANGYEFEAELYIWKNDRGGYKEEYSDNYQSKQYDEVIKKQITSINPSIDNVYFSSGQFTEKFNSIDEFLNKKTDYYFTIYMKDSFGDITADNSLELAKQIVTATKIQDAYFNFHNSSDSKAIFSYRYSNGQYSLA